MDTSVCFGNGFCLLYTTEMLFVTNKCTDCFLCSIISASEIINAGWESSFFQMCHALTEKTHLTGLHGKRLIYSDPPEQFIKLKERRDRTKF